MKWDNSTRAAQFHCSLFVGIFCCQWHQKKIDVEYERTGELHFESCTC